MPSISAGECEIYYERRGDGPAVVLIMGLGATSDWWPPEALDAFSRRFSVVSFDNRGTGRSSRTGERMTIRAMAEDTLRLMDALEIARADVFGYSMGGMIAQELALDHPERVRRLVLGATGCGGPQQEPPDPQAIAALIAAVQPDELRTATIDLLFPKHDAATRPLRVEQFWQRAARQPVPHELFGEQIDAILAWQCCDRLPALKIPTLIVHGREDLLVPLKNADTLKRYIPHAELRVFDGGHGFALQFLDEVVETVMEFLSC